MPKIKRHPLKNKHVDEMLELFSTAKSDREVAIVAGGFLEGVLHDFLKSKLVDSAMQAAESLFGYPRPMSSFAGMASMAFAFGMLSEREFRNLSIVRNVRNYFAHSLGLEGMSEVDFKADSVQALLQGFNPDPVLEDIPEAHLVEMRSAFLERAKKDPRGAFKQIFADTLLLLLARFRTVEKRVLPTDTDYEPGMRGLFIKG